MIVTLRGKVYRESQASLLSRWIDCGSGNCSSRQDNANGIYLFPVIHLAMHGQACKVQQSKETLKMFIVVSYTLVSILFPFAGQPSQS